MAIQRNMEGRQSKDTVVPSRDFFKGVTFTSTVVPVHCVAPLHKDVWGLEMQLHTFLNRHYIGVGGHLHAPAASLVGKGQLASRLNGW